MLTNLRQSLRQLSHSPGFVLLSVVILSLGIAGNTLVFSILNGVYLRPLPFKEPGRLVDLDETAPQWQLRYTGIAYPDFHAWRSGNRTFEGMAVWQSANFNLSSGEALDRVDGMKVTYDLAEVLGLRPVLGRCFTADEDKPGGAPVAMLGYATWQRLFGARADVLGQVILIDSRSHTVVGVLPREANFPQKAGLWVPLALTPADDRGWFLQGAGRLKDGVTIEQARADLERVHKGLVETRKVNEITSPTVVPLRDRYLGDSKPVAGVLLATAGLVLLIACANVAALMLARGLARSREMGIRQAMGASRWHIARQVLADSLLLSAAGGIGGVFVGQWIFHTALSWLPSRLPVWITLDLDFRFYLFSVGLTLVTAVLFGLFPALQGCSTDNLHAAISAATPRSSASAGRRRSLNLLVVGEVALTLLLLITAGLLARAFLKLQQTNPGFRPDHLLAYRVSLPEAGYPDGPRRYQFFQEHLERVRALPGVTAASAVTAPPGGGHWGRFFEAENAPPRAQGAPDPVVLNRIAYPQYFETMGIALLAGRTFTDADGRPEGAPCVIINELLAELYWPGQPSVGKRIRYRGSQQWMEVVGVVKDVKHYGLDVPMRPGVYIPAAQDPQLSIAMVVRTAVEPSSVLPAIREAVRTRDAGLPVHEVVTMSDRLRESLWVRRFTFWMTTVIAGVALLLAVGGIYGVVSYAAARRTSELGIRLALGAQRTDILRLVLAQGMRPAAIGIGIGLGGALVLTPLMRGLLFGVSSADPVTLLAIPLFLAAVTLVACWLPAWRATRLDPVEALRSE